MPCLRMGLYLATEESGGWFAWPSQSCRVAHLLGMGWGSPKHPRVLGPLHNRPCTSPLIQLGESNLHLG